MWAGSEHCREDETDRKPFSQKVGSLKCIFRKKRRLAVVKKDWNTLSSFFLHLPVMIKDLRKFSMSN